jgi:hypothetical protein
MDEDKSKKMRFRAKPVEVDAMLHDGSYDQAMAIVAWSEGKVTASNGDGTLSIETLEGTMIGQEQDWIIRGTKGEFYPCKPDIFLAKYEPVEPSEAPK